VAFVEFTSLIGLYFLAGILWSIMLFVVGAVAYGLYKLITKGFGE
jgi:hypothetical protein